MRNKKGTRASQIKTSTVNSKMPQLLVPSSLPGEHSERVPSGRKSVDLNCSAAPHHGVGVVFMLAYSPIQEGPHPSPTEAHQGGPHPSPTKFTELLITQING